MKMKQQIAISLNFLTLLIAGCFPGPATPERKDGAASPGIGADERFWPQLPDANNRFGIAGNPGESCGAEGVTQAEVRCRPPAISQTRDGRSVAVFDKVLVHNVLLALDIYLQYASFWRFHNYYGPQRNRTNGAGRSGIPWTAEFPPATFAQSEVNRQIRRLMADLPRHDGKGPTRETNADDFKPYKVVCNILRRGDMIYLHKDAERSETEYTALLFLNELWRKNDYGDLLFYDEGEVFASVGPKSNRIVIWDSSIDYLTRPPAMAYKQTQLFLMVHYTRNLSKVQQYEQEESRHLLEKKLAEARLFPDMGEPEEENINVEDHVMQKYVSEQGKQIFVLDNLFDTEDLDKLRMFSVNHGNYYFDDSIDSDSDNVQWIAAFDIDAFVQSRLWNITRQVAKYVSGSDKWFPYDIACNIIRSLDHTRIHEDCGEQEDEWTFLLYLNPGWKPEYYGETVFRQNNEANSEYVASVLPKYGRVVIFQGIIPHSARPPSILFDGARLSFAVKLSVNPWVARIKMLKQEFDHEETMHQSVLSTIKYYNDANLEASHKEYVISLAEGIWAAEEEEREQYLTELKKALQLEEDASEETDKDGDIAQEIEEDEDAHDNSDRDFEIKENYQRKEEDEYPEISRRKEYIYNLMRTLKPDAEALTKHYQQFLQDRQAMTERYVRELAKLI